jgi:hypothetical protein
MPKDELLGTPWDVRSPIWEELKGNPQALGEHLREQLRRLEEEQRLACEAQGCEIPDDEIMTELREIRRQMWEERHGAKSREPQAWLGSDDALSTPKP